MKIFACFKSNFLLVVIRSLTVFMLVATMAYVSRPAGAKPEAAPIQGVILLQVQQDGGRDNSSLIRMLRAILKQEITATNKWVVAATEEELQSMLSLLAQRERPIYSEQDAPLYGQFKHYRYSLTATLFMDTKVVNLEFSAIEEGIITKSQVLGFESSENIRSSKFTDLLKAALVRFEIAEAPEQTQEVPAAPPKPKPPVHLEVKDARCKGRGFVRKDGDIVQAPADLLVVEYLDERQNLLTVERRLDSPEQCEDVNAKAQEALKNGKLVAVLKAQSPAGLFGLQVGDRIALQPRELPKLNRVCNEYPLSTVVPYSISLLTSADRSIVLSPARASMRSQATNRDKSWVVDCRLSTSGTLSRAVELQLKDNTPRLDSIQPSGSGLRLVYSFDLEKLEDISAGSLNLECVVSDPKIKAKYLNNAFLKLGIVSNIGQHLECQ